MSALAFEAVKGVEDRPAQIPVDMGAEDWRRRIGCAQIDTTKSCRSMNQKEFFLVETIESVESFYYSNQLNYWLWWPVFIYGSHRIFFIPIRLEL
jgi:hypothetical protein